MARKSNIKGIVVATSTGLPIPGAKVLVEHLQTGFQATTATDDEGRYEVVNVPEGQYTITCSAPGYSTSRRPGKVSHVDPGHGRATGHWDGRAQTEYHDGESGQSSDAWLDVKTDSGGEVTDIVVGKQGSPHHDHYWKINTSETDRRSEVDWGSKQSGHRVDHRTRHVTNHREDHRK
jgi:hypothetical protein